MVMGYQQVKLVTNKHLSFSHYTCSVHIMSTIPTVPLPLPDSVIKMCMIRSHMTRDDEEFIDRVRRGEMCIRPNVIQSAAPKDERVEDKTEAE